MTKDVVVLSAARSAVGSFNGSLSGMEPAELAGVVMKDAIARSSVDPKQINYVTVGNCIPTESRFAYVPRVASIQAAMASSQGPRSSSVNGVPPRILATLAGGWKSSPSSYSQPSRPASSAAIVVLPDPDTPITTSTAGIGGLMCEASCDQHYPAAA